MKGYHLMLDVEVNPQDKKDALDNMNFIYTFLEKIVGLIKMHPISTPFIVKYDGNGKIEESGLSGFILIAESHISIHTYPRKNYFSMDIYSCKKFDKNIIINFLSVIFSGCRIKRQFVERGK